MTAFATKTGTVMQGRKEYKKKLFISFQLSERILKDNFYHKPKETLDLSFLRKRTQTCYGREGQKSIDPVVFFKPMLTGYLENPCSAQSCSEDYRIHQTPYSRYR
jgi:hypothetical protein